jgi:hypothetical protein
VLTYSIANEFAQSRDYCHVTPVVQRGILAVVVVFFISFLQSQLSELSSETSVSACVSSVCSTSRSRSIQRCKQGCDSQHDAVLPSCKVNHVPAQCLLMLAVLVILCNVSTAVLSHPKACTGISKTTAWHARGTPRWGMSAHHAMCVKMEMRLLEEFFN